MAIVNRDARRSYPSETGLRQRSSRPPGWILRFPAGRERCSDDCILPPLIAKAVAWPGSLHVIASAAKQSSLPATSRKLIASSKELSQDVEDLRRRNDGPNMASRLNATRHAKRMLRRLHFLHDESTSPRNSIETKLMTRVAVGGFLHETNTFAPTKRPMTTSFTAAAAVDGVWQRRAQGHAPHQCRARRLRRTGRSNAGNCTDHLLRRSPSAHVTEDAYERMSR